MKVYMGYICACMHKCCQSSGKGSSCWTFGKEEKETRQASHLLERTAFQSVVVKVIW